MKEKPEQLECKHCSLDLDYSTYLLCAQGVCGAPHENTDHTQNIQYVHDWFTQPYLNCVKVHNGFDFKTNEKKNTGTKKKNVRISKTE